MRVLLFHEELKELKKKFLMMPQWINRELYQLMSVDKKNNLNKEEIIPWHDKDTNGTWQN